MRNISKFLRMFVVLTSICIISGLSLAYVYSITEPRIKKFERIELLDSLKKVTPDASKFEEIIKDQKWNAYKNNEIIGTLIKAEAKGYGGPIQILFGMDNNYIITKVLILNQDETPGLGTKITKQKFLDQFTAKNKKEVSLIKDDMQNGKIDAITAATISSRAVVNAIKQEMKE